jgi:hypothetical protein
MRALLIAVVAGSLCSTMAGAQTAAVSPGAPAAVQGPLTGTNTFSERVIRQRLEGAGYTRIMGLRLDEQGIWRGTAMHNKAMVPVAIDYRMEVFEQ